MAGLDSYQDILPTELLNNMGGLAHSVQHDNVNSVLQGPAFINVKGAPYLAKGDNATNDYAAIVAAYDATPEGGTLFFPDPPGGAYLISGANTLTFTKRIRIVGAGPDTVLRKTGTGNLLVLGQNVAGQQKHGLHVADLTLATEAGAGDALVLRAIHHSLFQNILIPSAGGAGARLTGSLLNSFVNVGPSVNLPYTAGTRASPTHGVVLESGHNGSEVSGSHANTFHGVHPEGITTSPGVGIDLVSGELNVFLGPVSEGNTIGVRFAAAPAVRSNILLGLWAEANGTDISGTVGTNIIYYRDVTGALYNYLGDTPRVAGQLRFGGFGVEDTYVERESAGLLRSNSGFRALLGEVDLISQNAIGSVQLSTTAGGAAVLSIRNRGTYNEITNHRNEELRLGTNNLDRLKIAAGGTVTVLGEMEIDGALNHDGATVGFFGTAPATQRPANADTSGATLAALETEVNELKQLLRDYGLLAT